MENNENMDSAESQESTPNILTVNVVEVQAAKINLNPGDILAVTIKAPDLTENEVNTLRINLQKNWPNNKVLIFGIGEDDSITFSKISADRENKELSSCNTGNFCADCSCGKKEQYEGKQ